MRAACGCRAVRERATRHTSGSSEFVNDGFVTRGTWKKFDIYMNGHRHHNHSKVACCPRHTTRDCSHLSCCLLQVVPRTTRIVEQIFESTSMTSGNIKFSKLDAGTHM